MSKSLHTVFIATMVLVGVLTTLYLSYVGYDYYNTVLEERFYHPRHSWFKPSGAFGHGLGILGTLMILFGVSIYIARKRYNFLSKYLRLKYLLEFHIFLCSLGPVLILFHTAFKFGGIVSIGFWSMAAVVFSGILGRYIYLQIPRTIEGRELSLNEVVDMKTNIANSYNSNKEIEQETLDTILESTKTDVELEQRISSISRYFKDKKTVRKLNRVLRRKKLSASQRKSIVATVKNELGLARKIVRLQTMQKLFKYWHVVHMPFALIMLIIVLIHVGITLAFGYKWIF
jgi:hypothetical protein